MKKDDFRTECQSDLTISVVASYSGMSVDGGYSMSERKQQPQQKFSRKSYSETNYCCSPFSS